MSIQRCQTTSKGSKAGNISKSQGCIKKIPLNPPLQKGEAIGMPGLFEILPKLRCKIRQKEKNT